MTCIMYGIGVLVLELIVVTGFNSNIYFDTNPSVAQIQAQTELKAYQSADRLVSPHHWQNAQQILLLLLQRKHQLKELLRQQL